MTILSKFSDDTTARTCASAALQRAEYLAILGVRSVLELCVGPSLRTLVGAYRQFGIDCTGNDIDQRWVDYYPKGKWLVGDAARMSTAGFDAVVVAPPLSRGCSGRREDSLRMDQVVPSYYEFTNLPNLVVVYVLPGRTLSLRGDRAELHRFMSCLDGRIEVVPLTDKVVKYVDVYVSRKAPSVACAAQL